MQSDQSPRCALNRELRTHHFYMWTAKTDQTKRMPIRWAHKSQILFVLSCSGSNNVEKGIKMPNEPAYEIMVHVLITGDQPEPSLFVHIKYGSRLRVLPKIRHLAPLDGCACAFEESIYGGRKVP